MEYCYLRLDGRGVDKENPIGNKANLQYWTTPPTSLDNFQEFWEVFECKYVGNGEFSLISNFFKGVYLGLDGKGMDAFNPDGGGSVTARGEPTDETVLSGYYASAVSNIPG